MSNSTPPLILCVDGDHTALWVRALVLSVAGYKVLTATNGGRALQVFRLNPVDLVVIDLWRPDTTVTALVAEMKRIDPKVPVILLHGLTDLSRGFEQADLLLNKGITPPEFIEAIGSVLARSDRQARRTGDDKEGD